MTSGLPADVTRRAVIQGGLAGLAGLALPGVLSSPAEAQVWQPPRANYATPNFTLLRDRVPYVADVRPHRFGGARIERETRETSRGRKHIIHNYGHSGAGITLSWGSAQAAAREVRNAIVEVRAQGRTPSILVIGTGIIGLTTASEIKALLRGPFARIRLRMIGKAFERTPSFIAGGQFEPSIIFGEYDQGDRRAELRSLLLASHLKIQSLHRRNAARYGIKPVNNYSIKPVAGLGPDYIPFKPNTRVPILPPANRVRLPFAGLAGQMGFEYHTWLINPTVLMPRLRRELETGGVEIKVGDAQHVPSLADLLGLEETIIVNCTGIGAARLFPEPDYVDPQGRVWPRLIGKKGQLAMLKPQRNTDFLFSGGCSFGSMDRILYVFSRSDALVVGGSVENMTDLDTIDRLGRVPDLRRCCQFLSMARNFFAGNVTGCGPSPDDCGPGGGGLPRPLPLA